MKLQTQSTRSRYYRAGAVILTYLFLLLLSRGFVTSGDDWYFSARDTGEGLVGAFQAATHNAYRHYLSLNGRLLGNGSSRFFGTNDLLRELGRCAIILVILLQMCRMAKIRNLTMYAAALTLTVALPKDVYAQSYAWAAGFFNYVPPLMMIFGYIFMAERSLNGKKDSVLSYAGMFLLGLSAQLFVENVTVGLCMLSAGVLVWYLAVKRKPNFSLISHLAGAVIGCIVMFSAPGYANVNEEGYRQVGATFEELMKVVKSNFSVITRYLTEDNWLLIVPLTALCLVLLLQVKSEKKWQQLLRTAAMIGLMACPVWFYGNYNILPRLSYVPWLPDLRFWLDVAGNVIYLICVLIAVILGIGDSTLRGRAVLCIAAMPCIFGPLTVVSPIGPRCMYIPYMLLVCLVLILAADWAGRCRESVIRTLRIPAMIAACCVLVSYLWIAVWNGHCEHVRITQIENAMAAGASSVELPSYPYTDYVHNGNGGAIRYYYYYETPTDLEFIYIPHNEWYLN